MDEIVFPILRSLVWLLVMAPAVLVILGRSPQRRLLRQVALAVLVGGMGGALGATVLWILGVGAG
ncbi:MAG: hypothetical protein RLO51_24495 [Thalassobaculum sp.]|uniref:hypothetical protein n=1 Tax=Thalassobaculum sp. TaxID=2022740 RepID=UPI0032F0529F